MIGQLLLMIFPVAMAFAAANDLFTMRIPNKISLVLIAGFLVSALYMRMPLETFGLYVGVGAAMLAATFTLFSFNLFGGGDAKLMAVGALWMGPDYVLPFVAYVTILGGGLSILILAYRKFVPAEAVGLPGWAVRLHLRGSGIPYGIAIAAAALLVYPSTEWFRAFAV
ncbi:MAG: A24 family peptidase [Hyphomicrobium sp.]